MLPTELHDPASTKGAKSVIIYDWIMVLVLTALPLIALYQCVKFHLVPFDTFRNMIWTKELIKTIKGVNFIITYKWYDYGSCTLHVCSFPPLSKCEVSFSSFHYYPRYTTDKQNTEQEDHEALNRLPT